LAPALELLKPYAAHDLVGAVEAWAINYARFCEALVEAMAARGVTKRDALPAIGWALKRVSYLRNTQVGAPRYDLSGAVKGAVSEDEAAWAAVTAQILTINASPSPAAAASPRIASDSKALRRQPKVRVSGNMPRGYRPVDRRSEPRPLRHQCGTAL
jgi:sRNA-binding protein